MFAFLFLFFPFPFFFSELVLLECVFVRAVESWVRLVLLRALVLLGTLVLWILSVARIVVVIVVKTGIG